MENDVLLRDFLRRLDGIWKSKNKLEFECRIQFQKIDAIPEQPSTKDEVNQLVD